MDSTSATLTGPMLRPRVPYHDPSLPVVLLWSEKSGCTSLLTWFLHHTGRLDDARSHSDWIHDWEFEVMKADPDYESRVVTAIQSGVPTIKLVRDPFDRAVSSFFMMTVLGDDSGHFTVDLRRSLREWKYGDPDVPFGFGFTDFLRWMTTQDPSELNPHLGPQHTDLEHSLPDLELIRLADFDDSMRRLERRLGLDAAPLSDVTSSSHHTTRTAPQRPLTDAVGDVHFPIPTPKHWFLPPSAAFATDETVGLVRELFAVDYEAYGFEVPDVANPVAWWRARPLVHRGLRLARRGRRQVRRLRP